MSQITKTAIRVKEAVMARRGGLDEGREVEKSMSSAFSAGKPSIGTRADEEGLFEEEDEERRKTERGFGGTGFSADARETPA